MLKSSNVYYSELEYAEDRHDRDVKGTLAMLIDSCASVDMKKQGVLSEAINGER